MISQNNRFKLYALTLVMVTGFVYLNSLAKHIVLMCANYAG